MVETEKALNVAPPEEKLNPAAVVFNIVAMPVVFRVKVGVDVFKDPRFPEVEVNEIDVPVKVPVVLEITPEPKATRVAVVPALKLNVPREIPPLAAVVVIETAPVEVMFDPSVTALVSEIVNAEKLDPPEERVIAPVFVTLAVLVVLSVKAGVVVVRNPIVPEPELKLTDVVPAIVPAA